MKALMPDGDGSDDPGYGSVASASRLRPVTAIEAIVRQDGRRPSNAVTGGGRPLLLPDA